MQTYLEEAVHEHVVETLQPRFFKAKKGKKTAPFTDELTVAEVDKIMNRAMKQSDRYRTMKKSGYTEEQIIEAFNTPMEMEVFTYEGPKDTVMTPMDSLKYNKYFLRTGVMSMDPITGEVKAYAGGTNYYQFKYDMAGVGRRQVGSTIKPYLYSLAMENGFTPCDETRNVEQTLVTEDGKLWSPRNTKQQHPSPMKEHLSDHQQCRGNLRCKRGHDSSHLCMQGYSEHHKPSRKRERHL